MTKILKTVLGRGENTKRRHIGLAAQVVAHVKDFGLVTKPPESLEKGAALGVKLQFWRENEIPEVPEPLTRRELFSLCGKLVGHYPVAGWLRVACSYIKRHAAGLGLSDRVGEVTISRMKVVSERVKKDDQVKGCWHVQEGKRRIVWWDVSDLALRVVLEMNNGVVEDVAWLRKKDDYKHINVAELEAVLKGINLALKWGLQAIELRTDSATVNGWMRSIIREDKRVRTKGAADMIVK